MTQAKRQERTKSCITLALYYLLLKKPYDEITVSDICRQANVSRVSFYHYYDKKDDIFIQYSDEKFAEFYEEFTKKESITLEELIVRFFHFFKKEARQLLILKCANKQEMLIEQFYSYFRYIIYSNPTSHLFKDGADNVKISFIVGGVFEVIMRWLDDGMKLAPEEIASKIIEMIK
ncbi:MAG: TetR/AcrR family transcriptional regulator [Bacilli bacterium]|nr:TetR/AcrR family transcriptional regulator [Bacilli bacterium]